MFANVIAIPTGNISHFEPTREYNGREWCEKYNIMVGRGYTFCNGGFATKPCKCCGADLVVGMSVLYYDEETPFWVDACAGCGHAWEERAIPEVSYRLAVLHV